MMASRDSAGCFSYPSVLCLYRAFCFDFGNDAICAFCYLGYVQSHPQQIAAAHAIVIVAFRTDEISLDHRWTSRKHQNPDETCGSCACDRPVRDPHACASVEPRHLCESSGLGSVAQLAAQDRPSAAAAWIRLPQAL